MAAKFPIENKLFMEFDSSIQQTGILYGEIEGVQIACTHFSSEIAGVPYEGNYGDIEGQNEYEAKIVLGLMKSFEDGSP